MPDELDPRKRSAETKLRRTRQSLIEAADEVMRSRGAAASAEDIARHAKVSKATFYNFYKSRNSLCMDAFIELVVTPAENRSVIRSLEATLKTLLEEIEGRAELVRAAMLGRLEVGQGHETTLIVHRTRPGIGTPRRGGRPGDYLEPTEESDFVERTAALLSLSVQFYAPHTRSDITVPFSMAALYLFDAAAAHKPVDCAALARMTDAAVKAVRNN